MKPRLRKNDNKKTNKKKTNKKKKSAYFSFYYKRIASNVNFAMCYLPIKTLISLYKIQSYTLGFTNFLTSVIPEIMYFLFTVIYLSFQYNKYL